MEYLINYFGILVPVFTGLSAFVVAFFAIPVIINISHSKKLVDDPTGYRKIHIRVTPNLGGVAIFAAVVVSFLLSGYAVQQWVPYLIAGLSILFFSGLKDDIIVITPWKKLFLQLLAISALIIGGNLVITDMGGVFGFSTIPLWAGTAITFFTMVVVVNSYNLIDGIDGLAAGIGFMASLFFGGWFWSVGLIAETALSLALAGSLLAFLWYNFEPAEIFMGDTGSQVIGYLLAFLAVRFVSFGITAEAAVPFENAVPVLILALLIVPLYDTLRVFIIRAYRKQSPFRADRLHVHHQLLDMGFSQRTVCLIIFGFNIFIVGITLLCSSLNVNVLFALVLGSAVLLFPTFNVKRKILALLGIRLPSANHIYHLKKRLGMSVKTVGNETQIKLSNKSNGDHRDKAEFLQEEEFPTV